MVIERTFWKNLLEQAWLEKNIVWLMGVRRVGKTSLCQSLENVHYFDCERPRVRQLFTDPEGFLESHQGQRIVLDEIHRLDEPSELLKLAADHYPTTKIVATGSSTLGASSAFKDTLTGRKREVWLTPLLLEEIHAFGTSDIHHRFLYGGLPSFFLQERLPYRDFQEWIDAYWAKDIQEFFSVGKRAAFQKFIELLFISSGGMFEGTRFATACEVSRQTIAHYLEVLEKTFVIHVIRPYSTHKHMEIVKAPKVYGFDTGFVCYAKGWDSLRAADLGFMWEHCILNEIQGRLQTRSIHYWRDKRDHEIDFIVTKRAATSLIAIECKFNSSSDEGALRANGENFEAFRSHYPEGENFVVSNTVTTPFSRRYKDLVISFVGKDELIRKLQ